MKSQIPNGGRIAVSIWILLGGLAAAAPLPVTLEFFYDGNCRDCLAARDEALTDVRLTLPEVVISEYDVRADAGLRRLLAAQAALGVTDTHPVAVVLNGRVYLGGRRVIAETLFARLAEIITDADAPETPMPENGDDPARRFAQGLGTGMIMAAGLADGLNPCAFATIVFLAGLLLLRGRRPAAWWFCGVLFCAGVFSAYMLLGFGVLRVLTHLAAWRLAGDLMRQLTAAALVLLAAGSLRDAWVFWRTGRPDRLLLRLPEWLRRRAHRLTRWGLTVNLRSGLGMFVAGALVTLLEAPCTGQIYGPVLFYLSRRSGLEVVGLLLLYNLMFVLPHALVFVAASVRRIGGAGLAEWSRRNVVPAKALMALLMLFMAAMIILV